MDKFLVQEEGSASSCAPEMTEQVVDISQLCRICANVSELTIPIFEEEGLDHDLKTKISRYLPIKVKKTDKTPTQLCYQCASIIVAWHDLVDGCLDADKKLRSLFGDDSINSYDEGTPNNSMSDLIHLKPKTEDGTNDKLLSFKNYQLAIFSLRKDFTKKAMKSKLLKPTPAQMPKEQNTTPASFNDTTANQSTGSDLLTAANTSSKTVSESKHSCSSCGRLFTRAYDLKRHSLVHLNMETCEVKGDTYSKNVSGDGSDKTDCPKEIVLYSCEICSHVFKAKDSYERHKRIHSGERPFRCSECNKTFRDSGALSRHVREVHSKIKNHPCSVCNKWFANRATLEDHFRTHTGERPFVCHHCGIMFKSRAALYQHNKTHSDQMPYTCEYCGKRFRRRQQLVVHLPSHTDEKSHTCDKCGRGFSTRSELQRHISVHSEEKPFACTDCGASFAQKRYLKNHTKYKHSQSEVQSSGLILESRESCLLDGLLEIT